MAVLQTKQSSYFYFFVFGLLLLSTLLVAPVQANEPPPVRFGVLSIAQPARIFAQWAPFVKYLEKQLGRQVVMVVPKGFDKMERAVVNREVDFFYVNSYVFYRLKQEDHAIAVGQMQNINGKVVSQSEFFVRADSGINSVAELDGRSIAFVSPMGAGGYLAPRAYLNIQGIKVSKKIKEVFTKNLTTSLHQVLLGDVDAGAMCGVNYILMAKKVDTGELKIIGMSDVYPEAVIAARSGLEPTLIQRFTDIVVNMDQNKAGKRVLSGMYDMKIDSFVPYQDEIERITESLLKEAGLEL